MLRRRGRRTRLTRRYEVQRARGRRGRLGVDNKLRIDSFEAKGGRGEVTFEYDDEDQGIHQFFTVTVPYVRETSRMAEVEKDAHEELERVLAPVLT